MADKLELQIENGLAILTMTATEKLNTIGTQFSKEYSEAMDQLERDSGVRALILWGSETVFGAGADVRDSNNVPKTAFEGIAFSRGLHKLFARVEKLPYPTVAAIGGIALGGSLELALSCDFRIASESAKLGLPEVDLGTMPGAGGTQRLPRLVGVSKAKRMIFTGKKLHAAEALDYGLVDEVVPDGQLLESAKRFTEPFLSKAPLAIAMDKSAIDQGMRMKLDQALEYEAKCFAMLIETQDIQEGMRAFQEKRKPLYTGK